MAVVGLDIVLLVPVILPQFVLIPLAMVRNISNPRMWRMFGLYVIDLIGPLILVAGPAGLIVFTAQRLCCYHRSGDDKGDSAKSCMHAKGFVTLKCGSLVSCLIAVMCADGVTASIQLYFGGVSFWDAFLVIFDSRQTCTFKHCVEKHMQESTVIQALERWMDFGYLIHWGLGLVSPVDCFD